LAPCHALFFVLGWTITLSTERLRGVKLCFCFRLDNHSVDRLGFAVS
jgi:hypothetical protein